MNTPFKMWPFMKWAIIIFLIALIASSLTQCRTSKDIAYYNTEFNRYGDSADKYYNLWQAGTHTHRVLNKWIEYSELQTHYENIINHINH